MTDARISQSTPTVQCHPDARRFCILVPILDLALDDVIKVSRGKPGPSYSGGAWMLYDLFLALCVVSFKMNGTGNPYFCKINKLI